MSTNIVPSYTVGWEYQIFRQETASPTRRPPTNLITCCWCIFCYRFTCCHRTEDRGEESQRLLRTALKGGLWVLFSLIMPCSMRGKFFKIWLILQLLASLVLVGLSAAVVTRNSHHWNLISVIAYSIWTALTLLDILAHILLQLHYRTISSRFIVGCSFFRLLYTTFCLSIALMCDIFQLAVAFPDIHDGSGRVILARALLDFISFVSFTYGVVIVLVILTARVTSKLSEKDSSNYMKKFATKLFVSFLIHLVGQAIVQLFMLLTVTRRLHNDYPNIDKYLWTIVVLAIVIPIIGTLMYIVLNTFWIKQFLTGIFTTLLSIDVDSISSLVDVTLQQRIEQIKHSLNINSLRQEAAHLKDQRLIDKLLFPFQSPLAIILSASYTVLLLLFPVFTIVKRMHISQASTIVSALGSSLGWKIFYYISVGLYALLNIHALVVSFFWLMALLLLFTFILCVLGITQLPGGKAIVRDIVCKDETEN